MVTAGNHELLLDYVFLNMRFRMPLYSRVYNNYYSFNLGLIHYIFVNSIYY